MPEAGVALYLWIVGEDHPRACTGRRLAAHRLVHVLAPRESAPAAILLDPLVDEPLSARDAERVSRRGLAAVDCSWNRLGARGAYPDGGSGGFPRHRRRRLPWLRAGNPQHYARVGELNTAEALAAALYIVGEAPQADRLLDATGSGRSFPDLNSLLLREYAAAPDADGVRAVEARRW